MNGMWNYGKGKIIYKKGEKQIYVKKEEKFN